MERINLEWSDVGRMAHLLADEILNQCPTNIRCLRLYGVPRGGIPSVLLVLASLKSHKILRDDRLQDNIFIVDKPSKADVFIDDIIDTGKTRKKYEDDYYDSLTNLDGFLFLALVNKKGKDIQRKNTKNTWISFPWERMTNDDGPVANIVRLLEYIGEDPTREGLKDTPARVLHSYEKLFGGYKMKPEEIIKVFKDDSCDEMVLVKNMEFFSTCEHHMLPFYGKAHIAYIPNGQVIGVSKLGRILEMYSRRLQIQERLCQQVTELIDKEVKPLGSACILEAQHHCMTARGIEKQHSIMVTSSLTGSFKNKPETRNELLKMIGK